nr:hypothetical protein [Morchella crassipes]
MLSTDPSDISVVLPPGLICVRSETGDKNRRPGRALVGRFMIIYTRACDRWGSTYTLRQIIMMNFPAPATPEVRSILIPYRTLPARLRPFSYPPPYVPGSPPPRPAPSTYVVSGWPSPNLTHIVYHYVGEERWEGAGAVRHTTCVGQASLLRPSPPPVYFNEINDPPLSYRHSRFHHIYMSIYIMKPFFIITLPL